MNAFCDLHTHSVYSDGTCTPAEILDLAERQGLRAVALCDHNTVDGLPDFLAAAESRGPEAVAAAEFSVNYGRKELHLLGMFFPRASFPVIAARMEEVNRWKAESNRALVASLRNAGFDLDYDELCARTPKGLFNRALVAKVMAEKGYVSSVKEGFDRYLDPQVGHYREPKRLTVWEGLELICSVGAVPVLAHPFLNLSPEELEVFLPQAKEQGLVGMECAYSLFDGDKEAAAKALADRFGLRYSGGSDFHGTVKPEISLGTGLGNLQVPYAWLEELKTFRRGG